MKSAQKLPEGSVINRLLAMKFASECILIYPLAAIMFADRGALSASQIGTLLAAGFVLTVLFEIPTGLIADRFPRKYVLLMGLWAKFMALLAWLTWSTFSGYLVGVACFALGAALESGALQAYMYGVLGKRDKAAFGKFWSRASALILISFTLAYVLATVIGPRFSLLLQLSMGSVAAAIGLCASLPVDRIIPTQPSGSTNAWFATIRGVFRSSALMRLLAGSLLVVALSEVLIEFGPLYYRQIGVATRYVPLLLAASNVVGAVLFWTLHAWEDKIDKHTTLLSMLAFGVFCLSFVGWFGVAVVAAVAVTRYLRIVQVRLDAQIQHLSSDDNRATTASVASFGSKLLAASLVWLIGVMASGQSVVLSMRFTLLVGLLVVVVFAMAVERKMKKI